VPSPVQRDGATIVDPICGPSPWRGGAGVPFRHRNLSDIGGKVRYIHCAFDRRETAASGADPATNGCVPHDPKGASIVGCLPRGDRPCGRCAWFRRRVRRWSPQRHRATAHALPRRNRETAHRFGCESSRSKRQSALPAIRAIRWAQFPKAGVCACNPMARTSVPAPERGSQVELDIRGRRLDTARRGMLVLTCACGREGWIRVARLIAKHGASARFREVTVGPVGTPASVTCGSADQPRTALNPMINQGSTRRCPSAMVEKTRQT